MRAVRSRIVIVIVAALAVTAFGITRLFTGGDTPAQASATATLDGLTAQVTTAGWSNMDHEMSGDSPGYQMPAQMMPGMPEQGKQRLMVQVAVTNTTGETQAVRPGKEFMLYAGEGAAGVAAAADTFGDLPRLAPYSAVNGTVFFDLPAGNLSDTSAWIEWKHGGTTTRLTVPLNGAQPGPAHGH